MKKISLRKQYGRRAVGKTQTTITLPETLLEKSRENAAADGRSLSNYLERLLIQHLPPNSPPEK